MESKINYYVASGHYDSAEVYIQFELKKAPPFETIVELNHQLVSVYIYSSKYKDALDVAFKTIDRIKVEKDKARFYFLIGCIFYSVKDYEKAIEYFDLQLTIENPSLQAKALLILSDIYSTQNKDSKSVEVLEKANKICQNATVHPKLREQVSLQYNLQIKNFKICKQICEAMILDSTSFLNTKCNAFTTIGDCLMEQDSVSKAISYYEKALELTIETSDPDLIKSTSSLLIKAHEQIGNQEKANSYHKIYNDAINDSAYFSIDKYRELYALETSRSKAKKSSAPAENNYTILIIVVAVLSLTGLIVFYFLRKKKRNQQEQKAANKIQISPKEVQKIEESIAAFTNEQLYLEKNITRKSFCEKYGIKSERYLSQIINDKFKKSFSSFLNDLRVDYAHDRMKTDKIFRQYKTSEIAKSSGFGSLKTFERAFSAKFGQTPFDFIESVND